MADSEAPIRVLHVDDERDFAEMAAIFLEREDELLDITMALDAEEAMEQLDPGQTDCVISDHDMPGRNGIELLYSVRDEYPDLPFILFTGKGSEEVASKAISAGVTDYLQKQRGTEQYALLANKVRNAVEKYRARKTIWEQNHAFESFIEIVNDESRSFDQQMRDVLDLGREFLGLDNGIVSRIEPPDYHVEHVTTPDGSIEQGATFDIADTFCEMVFAADEAVAFRSPGAGGVEDHPCYTVMGLQAYLGEPLVVNGERYGTVNFSSPSPRREPFTAGEEAFIRTLTEWVSKELSRRRTLEHVEVQQKTLETRERAFRQVYEIIADGERSLAEQIDALLAVGREVTGTDYATLSHIQGDQYEFEAVDVADERDLHAETTTPLLELPICERVYETGNPLVLDDVSAEAPELVDPTWGVACYLGAPVVVDGEPYGTFCFYDVEPSEEGFSEWKTTFVELLADWVGAELTRRHAIDQLQRQNERLGEFASVVSHDLRSPLTVARSRLELAREQFDSEDLDECANAVDRCFGIIDDLLTLAQEGEQVGEGEVLNLAKLCDSCWQNVETSDATLVNEADRLIRADLGRLKQLLENLIRNAAEHGSETVTVTIGELEDGFYIADDGPGIPDDERDRVFDVGYSTTEDGTGFGLNIVKEIVEAHDWDIRVTDSEADGARFEITGVEFAE